MLISNQGKQLINVDVAERLSNVCDVFFSTWCLCWDLNFNCVDST